MNSKEASMAKAEAAASSILEVAALHYSVVLGRDWMTAEDIAQKLAQMAALSADGALLMGQMDD